MSIAERILQLRKARGLSQEQLANEIGVSRQAVSKWESQQSLPDLDKIIILSEYFNVSADYLLMGKNNKPQSKEHTIVSRILYLISPFIIFMGVICSCANWYEHQYMIDIFVGLLIVGGGILIYFIAAVLSSFQVRTIIKRLNIIFSIFIPLSLLCNYFLAIMLAPYPLGIYSKLLFCFLYFLIVVLIWWKIK